jgi:hypothetical protein
MMNGDWVGAWEEEVGQHSLGKTEDYLLRGCFLENVAFQTPSWPDTNTTQRFTNHFASGGKVSVCDSPLS